METLTIGLVIAIIVMLVLLMSCSQGGKRGPSRGSCGGGVAGMTAGGEGDVEEPEMYYANSGSGLITHKLNKQYADLADLSSYDDYDQVAQYSALEPEVYKSHEEYAHDINRSTSGASSMTIRTDPNDVISWRGLRRPDYHSVYADSSSRTVQSEVPETMFSATRYII